MPVNNASCETESTPRPCPRCGKESRPDQTICLYCDQDLSQPVRPRLGCGQFSLAFLLAGMVVVAVTLGSYRAFPTATIAMLMIVVPAGIRTAIAAYLRRCRGGAYSLGGLGITFLISLAAMFPVLTLAFAGFLAGTFVGGLFGPAFVSLENPFGKVMVLIGLMGGLAGAAYGLWITRPSE